MRAPGAIGLVVVACALLPATAMAVGVDAKGNGASSRAQLSADGRFASFESESTNLDGADRDPASSVFLRDLDQRTTTLVSRAGGAAGASANDDAYGSSISADGRYVAFLTIATNLDPDDTDTTRDIYVRDTMLNTTTLASRASGAAGAKASDDSYQPRLSSDGRFVAFFTEASNLDPADRDGLTDVYVRDLQAGTTTLVSRASGAGGRKGDGDSTFTSISADGRWVAFESQATNLELGISFGLASIFTRDLRTATTSLVSRAGGPLGLAANNRATEPAISGDGRLVAFGSQASNLAPGDGDYEPDVFLRDRQAGATTLVSRATGATGAKGAGSSGSPLAVSADGRFVGFGSNAANLHPDDTDAGRDVYLRDAREQTTTLISRATQGAGAKGNGYSGMDDVSGDGRFVAFDSAATNLSPDDTDALTDVFVRDVASDTTTLVSRGPGVAGGRPIDAPPFPGGCPLKVTALVGSPGVDTLRGSLIADVVIGRGGNDHLRGLQGADCLYGDAGRDRLLGGSGADRIFGGTGDDRVSGQAGGDKLVGGLGADRLSGGAGDDRIDAVDSSRRALARRDLVSCGAGRDRVSADRRDRVARDCERVTRRR